LRVIAVPFGNYQYEIYLAFLADLDLALALSGHATLATVGPDSLASP
jgi:hypothetical protein